MKVGVTGSRNGWTIQQEVRFNNLILDYIVDEFHHGDCVGVDEQSVGLIREYFGEVIHTHPPLNSSKRAHVGGRLYVPKEYIERNHDIVDAVDMLFVIPATKHEVLRSGTWATLRYALKQLKDENAPLSRVAVIYPDGTVGWASPGKELDIM